MIESNTKRISFLKTPLKAKFLLRVFSIVIYHIFPKGFVVSRGGGGHMSTDKTSFQKNHFAL